MGGFAKYPWPQYLSNAPFYYNKHYKRSIAFTAFAGVVNLMWILRFAQSHSVFLPPYLDDKPWLW